jgi:hypothetical protein
MDRGSRHNAEKQIRKLARKSGDNCTICGAEFQHNTRTVGGLTADGTVALAGEPHSTASPLALTLGT